MCPDLAYGLDVSELGKRHVLLDALIIDTSRFISLLAFADSMELLYLLTLLFILLN